MPSSPGIPAALAELTLTLEYNNIEQANELFAEVGDEIACVIVEPVAGNMNCVPPIPGFLECLRENCSKHGAVFIIDEVMTGFRVGLTGAQGHYGIEADLTTLGKVIGGGMPVGAFGGKKEIMDFLAPVGPVYQAGTLSGNPIAMTAGLKNLEIITRDGFYESLTEKNDFLVDGILAAARSSNIPMSANKVGAMFGLFFTDQEKVQSFADVCACDVERFKKFFHGMLDAGVNLAPSAYEAGFVSMAHEQSHLQQTIDAASAVFKTL